MANLSLSIRFRFDSDGDDEDPNAAPHDGSIESGRLSYIHTGVKCVDRELGFGFGREPWVERAFIDQDQEATRKIGEGRCQAD